MTYSKHFDYNLIGFNSTSSWVDAATLVFKPDANSKFVVMGMAVAEDLSISLPGEENPYYSTDNQVDFVLTVDGVTECEIKQTYCSFLWFGELTGTTHTFKLRSRDVSATTKIKSIRLLAFNVEDWQIIEQETDQTLSGNITRTAKMLMQQHFYNRHSQVLCLSYAEIRGSSTGSNRVYYKNYINQDNNSESGILDIAIGPTTEWKHVSTSKYFDLTTNKTEVFYSLSNLTDSGVSGQVRRIRTIFLPIDKKPFAGIQKLQDNSRNTFTGKTYLTDGITASIFEFSPYTRDQIDYLAIGAIHAGLNTSNKRARTTLRFNGSSMGLDPFVGTTTTPIDGVTTTILSDSDEIFNIGIERLTAGGIDAYMSPIQGLACFGFHYGSAIGDTSNKFIFYTDWNKTWNSGPDNSEDQFISEADRNLILLQFEKSAQAITEYEFPTPKQRIGKRHLIEINKQYDIKRYTTGPDLYLFDGLTIGQIVSKISNGDICRCSAADLTITGAAALNAIDAGDTAQAESLLLLQSGLPAGTTASPISEYPSYSSIWKLYESKVSKFSSLDKKSTSAYFGISGVDNLTIEFANGDGEFLQDNPLETLKGAVVKLKEYDPINQTLITKFSGRVVDIKVGTDVTIGCISPNTDVLDVELPKTRVGDIYRIKGNRSGLNLVEPDDPGAKTPIFFGEAKKLQIPNSGKEYGTDTTFPEYIEAYSDYIIGGPGFGSKFLYVLPVSSGVTTGSDTGIYRAWTEVEDITEFSNSDIVRYDEYKYHDQEVPYLRFVASTIETPTLTGQVPLPHPLLNTIIDVTNTTYKLYPQFAPVNKIISVGSGDYIEGEHWTTVPGFTSTIRWISGTTLTQPEVRPQGLASDISIVRYPSTPAEELLGENVIDVVSSGVSTSKLQIINLGNVRQDRLDHNGLSRGTVTFTEGQHYSLSSTYRNRELEDKINWSIIKDPIGVWEFTGDLTDTSSNNITLLGDAGQPIYSDTFDSLHFDNSEGLGEGLGVVYAPATTTGNVTTSEDFRAVAYVQANDSGFCNGTIISKSTSPTSGFRIESVLESTIISGGSTTKSVPRIRASDGSAYIVLAPGLTSNTANMADGNIHKVEFRVKRKLVLGNLDFGMLFYDGVLISSIVGSTSFKLSNGDYLVFGGVSRNIPSYLGKLHKVFLAKDGEGEPGKSEVYQADWYYLPDSYTAEWEYTVTTASNPITVAPIAGDFKVAGSDLVPTSYNVTFPNGVGATSCYWVGGPDQTGYAIRFNNADASGYWTLGTSQLGTGTTLAPTSLSTGEGYIQIANHANLKVLDDFSLYFYGTWTGIESGSGLAIAKERGANSPSYAVGINGGRAYGMVTAIGDVWYVEGRTVIDSHTPVFIHLERKSSALHIYVNGVLDGVAVAKRSVDSDYDTSPVIIASKAIIGFERWVGDISFFGMTDFAGGPEFSKMMFNAIGKGIKGMFTERYISSKKIKKQTIFNFPLTEGEGAFIKNRNLHKNVGLAIKRLLIDNVVGVNSKVDPLNFDKAITMLDDLGLKVDFTQVEPRKLSDILNDLCFFRGILIRKDTNGYWTLTVDDINSTVKAAFGSGDGFYNNIIRVSSYETTPADQSVNKLTLEYNSYPNNQGELIYNSSLERPVNSYGTEQRIVQNPYILDHVTADKVLDYNAKKLRYADEILNITVASDGERLDIGNIVEITIPRFNINRKIFQISEIRDRGIERDLKLVGFSTQIFTYDPGALPTN